MNTQSLNSMRLRLQQIVGRMLSMPPADGREHVDGAATEFTTTWEHAGRLAAVAGDRPTPLSAEQVNTAMRGWRR